MPDSTELRALLVASLGDAAGAWHTALAEVPRHEFIPPLVWRQQRGAAGNDLHPVRRDEDPAAWLALAYADEPVNTQVDDGCPDEDGAGHEVTSSASQPAVVADMLVALDAEPGMRVLEIGTGTGYNAALLAHRLGPGNIISIEIDPQVAEHARTALMATGNGKVTVITGDGAEGNPERAPFDRVIATAGVTTVPYPWIEQTRPGGRIVVPMTGRYQPPGVLALDVHDDGTASGRFSGPAAFMALRAQRVPRPRGRPVDVDAGDRSTTEVHPYYVAGDRDAATSIGLRVQVHRHYADGVLWLLDGETDSWASVTMAPDPPYEVRQGGRRRLWDEVAAAYTWWTEAGEPSVGAWLCTVTPAGQRVALLPAWQHVAPGLGRADRDVADPGV